ncbi:hypoxanthine-guanine phosphoribosyltransferase [Halorhodospira halochloris]|uniref:hypoxanthine-guanine phosphoribosyltransferase n=1 Tax=Halorhodospira halochloris TaxID=1052 RepID=UPI001EE7CB5D|nr:hypoxanthine-guanine phosphoribosyltransferase [Halorhodospira halochloris]MCG5531368.1 hypoxanthine-guanine phosphoribosyltransferase [Halorhodospira halochloris]MCG5549406.1 hypoxanthine-guanine phosphoribosyltransferase [Halorhodospira halochloris]
MPWEDVPELKGAELIFDADAIEQAYDRIAAQITSQYSDKRPLILSVMIGGIIPAGQIVPRLDFPLEMDYLHATRYRNETRGGDLVWHALPSSSFEDRDIIVIDDILDEGFTLVGIIDALKAGGARSVATAVLVNKIHERKHEGISADFFGVEAPDRYLFGAGMDCKGLGRNAPGIYAIDV